MPILLQMINIMRRMGEAQFFIPQGVELHCSPLELTVPYFKAKGQRPIVVLLLPLEGIILFPIKRPAFLFFKLCSLVLKNVSYWKETFPKIPPQKQASWFCAVPELFFFTCICSVNKVRKIDTIFSIFCCQEGDLFPKSMPSKLL